MTDDLYAQALAIAVEEEMKCGYVRPGAYKNRPIDYVDPAPKPFIVQIPLVEYFERITRHKADRWQTHFCEYLQKAAENRHIQATKVMIHAQPRLGKSRILAQCYPAWLLGHDPLHRIALATYGVSQSQLHSQSVISILNLDIHKEIFPDPAGWVPPATSKERWKTNGRKKNTTDTERSFNPVGLQSGLTGAGFDTLLLDDPYSDSKEAFSEAVRRSLTYFFWEGTVNARIDGRHSNVFGMFHRYNLDDMAGYLLDKGDFDYLRYAAIADGDYIHESTGQRFPDPLGREVGEYISERFGENFYRDKRKDKQVWNSQFQGRPTSEEGDFFNVGKICTISGDELRQERAKCVLWVRAWDHAATTDSGDYSSGTKIGIQPDGKVLIDDLKLAQVDTAGRMALQINTAKEDGTDVPVCVPKELAAAGKDVVFFTEQWLKGYNVIARSVISDASAVGSNAKARRAHNLSVAVNSGQVLLASDELLPDDDKWNATLLRCMRNFGFSSFDDPIDSTADGYNYLFEQLSRGLIMRSFAPQRNLLGWKAFAKIFGDKVPAAWQVYVGVKITNEDNRANSAVIVARASENTKLKDTLFVIAEYKEYNGDFYALFDWIDESLKMYCTKPKAAFISLHADSEMYISVIKEKLNLNVAVFEQDRLAGIAEANWYMLPRNSASLFGPSATGLYALVNDEQLSSATDRSGLYSFRQEAAQWGFNDKGDPTALGDVLDCLRMVTFRFRTTATALTPAEERENTVPPHLRLAEIEVRAATQSPEQTSRELQTHDAYASLAEMLKRKTEETEDSGYFSL